jgi:hypothetical protein
MAIPFSLNDLAKLTLIASDAAYFTKSVSHGSGIGVGS